MTYREQSFPVIKLYEASGKVQRVDSSKGSPEEVFAATKDLFAGLIPGADAGPVSGSQAATSSAAPKSSMSRFLGAPFQHGHAKQQEHGTPCLPPASVCASCPVAYCLRDAWKFC